MSEKITVMQHLLGGADTNVLIAAYIFALVGMIIYTLQSLLKGLKGNRRTPRHFSLKYWIKDNLLTKIVGLFVNLLIIFVFIRFSNELLGKPLTMFVALLIGFGVDYYADKLKDIIPGVKAAKESNLKLE